MSSAPVVLKFSGSLDAAAAKALRPDLDELAQGARSDVVVDLSAVDFIDSSGIGAIVFLFKRLAARGHALRLRGVRGQPLRLMEFLRISRVIALEPSAEEAA